MRNPHGHIPHSQYFPPHKPDTPPSIPLSQPSLFIKLLFTLSDHFSVFSSFQEPPLAAGELFLLFNVTFAILIPPCTVLNHSSLPKQPPKALFFFLSLSSLPFKFNTPNSGAEGPGENIYAKTTK